MHTRIRWFCFLLFGGLSVPGAPLHASPLSWQLMGVTFSDGATASGTFTYDAAIDSYTDWNIAVTAGILPAYDYRPGVDAGFLGIHPAGQVDFVAFPPATTGRYVRLTFATPLADAGGVDLFCAGNLAMNATTAAHSDLSPLVRLRVLGSRQPCQ